MGARKGAQTLKFSTLVHVHVVRIILGNKEYHISKNKKLKIRVLKYMYMQAHRGGRGKGKE